MNENKTNTGCNRPSLTLYHANARGTGSAIRFALHPATADADGYISVAMACQKSVGHFPIFDWDNSVEFMLMFADVAQFLQVFRGEVESVADGKGIYYRESEYSLRVVLRHIIEPMVGYSLEVYRKDGSGAETSVRFFLTSAEALGICCAFEDSLGLLVFGDSSKLLG